MCGKWCQAMLLLIRKHSDAVRAACICQHTTAYQLDIKVAHVEGPFGSFSDHSKGLW